ncbi:MAG: DUF6279 family lipoprotein [Burkholderiales bacterium]|nr:DUF6279 family lipoprotein [Burkholderiales bacterium]
MSTPARRASFAARAFAVVAVVALAGCGSVVRIAYNNGDFALRMVADDYLDLRAEQARLLDASLARLHAWHRREELPRYAAALEDAAERVARGVTAEDIVWATDTVRARYRALVARAIDESLPLAAALTPDNLSALERKLASGNRKYAAEYLSADAAAAQRARADAIAGRVEEWLGQVSAEQRRLIAAYVQAQPQHLALRFEDRKARQREFVRTLGERALPARQRDRLRALFLDYESGRTAAYARSSAEWQRRLADLVLDIAASATREQRDHAADRLRRYAVDFRLLAAEKAVDSGQWAAGSDEQALAAPVCAARC